VSFVLEGSVRRAGEQVRVTAQLIDARTDRHVWSETYDKELREVFKIQDEIAAAIVDRLKPVVLAARGGAPKATGMTTDDMQAYDLYLRGRALFDRADEAALEESVEQLEQSIAIDAGFARAHSALSRSLMALAVKRDDTELRDRALHQAEAALAANPQMREAFEVRKAATEWQAADSSAIN
jgi:adenylate cyclase